MRTTERIAQVESFDVGHLGIVAGIADEIGVVEAINRAVGRHEQEVVSAGVAVKAMLLNGLGFVSAPLYLFQEFFVGKATEHLLGTGIRAAQLNDDKLGRVLDKLYAADLTQVFVTVALQAARRYGVRLGSLHADTSSFSVHGAYDQAGEELPAIRISHGYSREHRPDLKQFMVDLICSGDGDVPVYFRAGDGNESDKAVLARLIRQFQAQVDVDALFVADSALYSADNLQALQGLRWLTRVPHTVQEAQDQLRAVDEASFQDSGLAGYRLAEGQSEYGGIRQRWLIVESQAAQERARAALQQRLRQQEQALSKALRTLRRRRFRCEADAQQAAATFAQPLRYHRLRELRLIPRKRYRTPGRPRPDTPTDLHYQVEAQLVVDQPAVDEALRRAGRFILASNVLDHAQYSNDQLLAEYKAQQAAERGFRFLRDPLFFTSSVFLKTPQRIAALAMVLALCLLLYSLGQRLLRQHLAQSQATIRHQTGKPTARPTLRWVFQLFQAVHLLIIDGVMRLSNLSAERQRILSFLTPCCQKYYLLL